MNCRRLIAVILPLITIPASAQQPGTDPRTLFKRLDKNRDGFIAADELAPERRAIIKRLDTDGDGKISLEEHLKARGPNSAPPPNPGAPKVQFEIPDSVEPLLDVDYSGNDNPRQKLDLYRPKKRASEKPLPVVVFVHGGGWKAGDKSSGMRNIVPYVASGDYAGVSIGYRLTNEAQWPAQLHDCKAGLRWIRAHAAEHKLDPDRIAVWGSSAGGHLVSILGTTSDVPALEGRVGKHTDQSSRVQAVVNFYGPEDFITMVSQPSTVDRTTQDYPEALLLGGRVQDVPEAAKNASPVTYISKSDPPVLTAHGTNDPLVPFAQAEEFHAALRKAGVSSTLITMKNGGHGFGSSDLDAIVHRFLDKTLRGIDSRIEDTTIELAPRK